MASFKHLLIQSYSVEGIFHYKWSRRIEYIYIFQDKDWKKEIIDYTLEISLIIILYSAQEGYE